MRVWYRTKARINKIFADAPRETPGTHFSPATRLPQEIVENVFGHLIYDTRSLIACSLTCYSWYIASLPHLHHTFVIRPGSCFEYPKLEWPKPLQEASKLGLLPFVKKVLVKNPMIPSRKAFSRKRFNPRILQQFSALTNVRELELSYLDVPSFMPCIQRFFGHFTPTVRSLTLISPTASRRQIIFFIGSFQHLDNLTFRGEHGSHWGELPDDSTLIPPFAPPLQGRLEVSWVGTQLLKDMHHLFGGTRFRYIAPFNVTGTRFLLSACAKTLETLRLYPNVHHCK
jgi:hypothetical protein